MFNAKQRFELAASMAQGSFVASMEFEDDEVAYIRYGIDQASHTEQIMVVNKYGQIENYFGCVPLLDLVWHSLSSTPDRKALIQQYLFNINGVSNV